MGLGAPLRWLDRWAGKFNRWFGGAAVAASAEHTGALGGPTMDPTAVVAALGELERERPEEEERPG